MEPCLLSVYVVESDTPVFSPGLGIESIMIWANDSTSLKPLFTHIKMEVIVGLSWWSSGKESSLQCRGCVLDPWSGS